MELIHPKIIDENEFLKFMYNKFNINSLHEEIVDKYIDIIYVLIDKQNSIKTMPHHHFNKAKLIDLEKKINRLTFNDNIENMLGELIYDVLIDKDEIDYTIDVLTEREYRRLNDVGFNVGYTTMAYPYDKIDVNNFIYSLKVYIRFWKIY